MKKLDKFHYHEILHMSSFLANAVDCELVEHPAIRIHPEFLALAKTAARCLSELYNEIGTRTLPRDDK